MIFPIGCYLGGYIPFSSYGYGGGAPAFDVYGGVVGAGLAIFGGVGSCPSPGSVGRCMEYYLRKLGVGRSDEAPEAEPGKQLPPDTDSPDYSKRAGAYVREKFNTGTLPKQSDVLANVLGRKPSDGVRAEEKRKDGVLRDAIEKIIYVWAKDPKACGGALRKLDRANGDVAGTVRALFDPYGDDRYLKHFNEVVDGLKDSQDPEVKDKNWKLVADWFERNVGPETVAAMADSVRVLPQLQPENVEAEKPLSVEAKEEYIGKLVDRDYKREEAEAIVSGWKTEDDAEEAMDFMDRQGDSSRLDDATQNQMPELQRKLEEAKAMGSGVAGTLARAQRELAAEEAKEEQEIAVVNGAQQKIAQANARRSAAAAKQKQIGQEMERLRDAIDQAKGKRAEKFLQDYVKFVESRYGVKPSELGYKAGILPEGVKDVPTAVRWVNNKLSQRGFDVNVAGIAVSGQPAVDSSAGAEVLKRRPGTRRVSAQPAAGADATTPAAEQTNNGETKLFRLKTPKTISGKTYEYVIRQGANRLYANDTNGDGSIKSGDDEIVPDPDQPAPSATPQPQPAAPTANPTDGLNKEAIKTKINEIRAELTSAGDGWKVDTDGSTATAEKVFSLGGQEFHVKFRGQVQHGGSAQPIPMVYLGIKVGDKWQDITSWLNSNYPPPPISPQK